MTTRSSLHIIGLKIAYHSEDIRNIETNAGEEVAGGVHHEYGILEETEVHHLLQDGGSPESDRQQRTVELGSVSGIPARVDSLQSSIERRYLSGFLLGKHRHSSKWILVIIILPVLREVEEGATVEDIFPSHHLEVHLGPVAFLLSFELSHASKLNMRPVSVVQHGGVRHRHPGSVLVLLSHAHLLAERLHGGHIATIEQQLLENSHY